MISLVSYWYYYMAIVNSIVRVTGGIVVGVFQYMSDSGLYQLSQMEGHSVYVQVWNSIFLSREPNIKLAFSSLFYNDCCKCGTRWKAC